MSLSKSSLSLLLFILNMSTIALSDGLNLTALHSADKLKQIPSLNRAAAAVVVNSPMFKPAVEPIFSLNLLSSFPEDLEISDYCKELLNIFGQRYVAYVSCLVPAARPVTVCQKCFSSFGSLREAYANISSESGPGNVSCSESLLRGDRLMVVNQLNTSLEELWTSSACDNCVTKGLQRLTNDTLYFMNTLNQTDDCFDKYRQGNHTELCKNCKSTYQELNELYGRMEKNQTMCIDIEDSMNMTRRLWSKYYNCSVPREETVPVIAVSSFMLFLPIIFYLSSFLHSEQKKRKLIHPKRAKSYTSLMNIQDKLG
ncbi:osteopetrosis-associated transmembrane protein 1 [Sparus aurata]|uniref:Osteoclastosis associated transmembrane protein 1 n=1 Tax=Sparus aurata TaxID=8175 RepID=A0A671V4F0_SPAAU|nr:osteopetrosis-associated transmembrane protein 1 [Sparus aurata]